MDQLVKYVRLERKRTNSWITFRLAKKMRFDDKLVEHLLFVMPEWELVNGCVENPDVSEDI